MDYKDGVVGCMRGLMVNGVLMDLRGKVERGEVTYGVSSGNALALACRIHTTQWRKLERKMQC